MYFIKATTSKVLYQIKNVISHKKPRVRHIWRVFYPIIVYDFNVVPKGNAGSDHQK